MEKLVVPSQGEIFDAINDTPTEFIQFITQFMDKSKPILEAGCGTGRVLVPLAQMGYQINGVDQSEEMLDSAQKKINQNNLGETVKLYCDDFKNFSVDKRYNIVFFSTDTFTMIPNIIDRLKCIVNLSSLLQDGGKVIIPLNNLTTFLNGESEQYFDREGEIKGIGHVRVTERREIDTLLGWRIGYKKQIFTEKNCNEEDTTESKRILSIVTRNEVQLLFHQAGLRLETVYGSFNFSPLTEESPKMIFVGVKDRKFPYNRGEIYDSLHTLQEDYFQFIKSFIKEDMKVLELGCGTGRITIPLAESGVSISGIDNDTEMLNELRKKRSKKNLSTLHLYNGDFCNTLLDKKFDFAFFSSNTFILLPTFEERLKAFQAVSQLLNKGAELLLIFENPCLFLKKGYERTIERKSILKDGSKVTKKEYRKVDLTKFQRVGFNLIHVETGKGLYEMEEEIIHSIVTRDEIILLAHLCGYRIKSQFGDYSSGVLTQDSPKAIYVLEKHR